MTSLKQSVWRQSAGTVQTRCKYAQYTACQLNERQVWINAQLSLTHGQMLDWVVINLSVEINMKRLEDRMQYVSM